MPHALVATVEAAIAPPLQRVGERFLPVLERRLAGLAGWTGDRATLTQSKAEHRAARCFLASVEGSWDDGDEALVRGLLDRWSRSDADRGAEAEGVLEAAGTLARLQTRPETLWFFLWEMQSICDGLASRGAAR